MADPEGIYLEPVHPSARDRMVDADDKSKSEVIRWRPGEPTGFNIAVVNPAHMPRAGDCVVPMSHDYRIDRMVLKRLELLSDVTGYRVVAVETPGITMCFESPAATGPARVAGSTIRRVLVGDFDELADTQLNALTDLTDVEIAGSRILGESLGAQLGTSLAAISRRCRSLDLVEPVNAHSLSPLRLWRLQRALLGIETDRKADYIRANAADGWGDVTAFELSSPENAELDQTLKAFRRQGKYATAIAVGLTRGIDRSLRRVDRSTPTRVWRANASAVCLPDDVAELTSRALSWGMHAQAYTLSAPESWPAGLGHHSLSNLNLMLAFSLRLSKIWDADGSRDQDP